MNMWKILSLLIQWFGGWVPDKLSLSILYKASMGRWMNWKNPQTFTEKIQWLKLYNRKPEFTTMVDKLAVKKFVANIIGEKYVIPTLGVWDRIEDIDFDILPNKFVLKTTHGGGSCGVVLCTDKSNFDKLKAFKKLRKSLRTDIYKRYREWPYKNVPRKIIAEPFIEIEGKQDLTDYKIFCFNGEPEFIQVIQDRNTKETIDFFDKNWSHQSFLGLTPGVSPATNHPQRPTNLKEMLRIARILSRNTDFLRVDLYQTPKGILFGELTFFPNSGVGVFSPDDTDIFLGNYLKIRLKD